MASSQFIGLKLHPERDADILAAIADASDKSARLRELIRDGLAVKRLTLNAPEIVKRKTILEDESVLRKTIETERKPLVDERPKPPEPVPAENPPAGSGNGKPPPFVAPPGFLQMTRPEQNKLRADYEAFVAQWKKEHSHS